MARLGDLFLHIKNGANIKQGLDNTGYPITRIETISNRTVDRNKMGYAGITDLEKYSDFVMQDGDILMSHINSETHLGKTALYEKEGDEIIIHGMNLLSLRPNKDLITSKYAFYYLLSQSFLRQIPNITKKSVNQASFTVSALKELVFPLTSIEEQKKITVDLDKVHDLISLRKQQLAKLDELVKSRFVELFGDRYTNDRNWESKPLYKCATFYNGKAHEQVVDENGEYILVTSRCIASDVTDYRRTNALLFPLQVNDIAMVMSDVPNGRALAKCILIDEDNKYTLNQRICCLRDYSFNPIFFYYLLNRHEYFLSFNDGNAQTNLRKDDLLACNIIIPPIELQNQFAAFVEQTDKSKFEIQKSLAKLETLKKALVQKYFG